MLYAHSVETYAFKCVYNVMENRKTEGQNLYIEEYKIIVVEVMCDLGLL